MLSSQLAGLLDLGHQGPDRDLVRAAPLETAGAGDLAFVASPKALARATTSAASCLLVPPEYEPVAGQTVIVAPNPRASFAAAVSILHPPDPVAQGVDPTAIVAHDAVLGAEVSVGAHAVIESRAVIGAGTHIGAGCFVGRESSVGEGSRLHPRVTIYARCQIGARAILHSGVVIGADGFGFEMVSGQYRKFPQVGVVILGDDVELGANTCVDRAALGVTRIGNGTKLDNLVHIGHNCQIGNHVVIAAQTGLAGGVTIGDYAVIGGQVGVGDKARIEAKSIVGSGAGILTSKVVRSGQVMWGTPARPLKEYLEQLALLARLPVLQRRIAKLEQELAARNEDRD